MCCMIWDVYDPGQLNINNNTQVVIACYKYCSRKRKLGEYTISTIVCILKLHTPNMITVKDLNDQTNKIIISLLKTFMIGGYLPQDLSRWPTEKWCLFPHVNFLKSLFLSWFSSFWLAAKCETKLVDIHVDVRIW